MQMPTPVYRNEHDRTETGDKIRERRLALGLSQDQLADRLGSKRNDVSRYENAGHEMGICTFFQYCDALETNPLALCPDRYMTDSLTHLVRLFGQLTGPQREAVLRVAEAMLPTAAGEHENSFDGKPHEW